MIRGRKPRVAIIAAVLSLAGAGVATAQWDPANGEWLKEADTDIRVMTYNVKDGIRTEAAKIEGFNQWSAMAHIVAAMKPDILVMQETGDNNCGGCVDSVAELEMVIDLLLHGGVDPWNGNSAVTSYVQLYDPTFDMPYVFVSDSNDGYNRNLIVSRFPFADLNGDTRAEYSDIPFILAPAGYAVGGFGGIRGFMFAEVDLPDETYAGNFVMGNAHLKAGGSSSDLTDRLNAAKNVAYFVDYFYNGAGTGIVDPDNRIFDSPVATMVLDGVTPVVLAGDWNEDELTNGRKGPAEWLQNAQLTGSTDGTDFDRTDSTYDASLNPFTGTRGTFGTTGKLDYILWQDSVATLRRSFIFFSNDNPTESIPPELQTFFIPQVTSGTASDHRPVIADFILPLAPQTDPSDFDMDGDVDLSDFSTFSLCFAGPNVPPAGSCPPGIDADFDDDGDVDLSDFSIFSLKFTGPL